MKSRAYLNDLAANRIFHISIAIIILIILALWIIKAFNIAYPINITTRQTSGELAVVGEGTVDVVPDTANVTLGIIVNNTQTVEEAQSQINTVNNAIISAMEKLGIQKENISTSNYSINPNYDYGIGANEITGYSGNASVNIKVKNLDILPQVIENSTASGANQVLGTNFVIDNPENFRTQARNVAIKNARQQAEEIADNLDIKLGNVTNIIESTPNNNPLPPIFARDMAVSNEGLGGTANLQPGSQTITSTVTLYFDKR